MLSPEEIAEQQQLLAAHRRTLAVYLRQRAEIGRSHSPPSLVNGIDDARANIQRIKAALTAAGATVPEDPDDEEPPPPPRLVLPNPGSAPPWLWPALVGLLAIALVAGVAWYLRPASGTAAQLETSIATPEVAISSEEAPTAEEATPDGGAPAATTDPAVLESQLADANIELSAVQADEVRRFLEQPDTGYRLLAEHALQVIGDQKFQLPLYLDELDTRYTELVGEAHYLEFDEDRLREAMVRAWNEHYTDQQVDSLEQIVEARS